jgi:endonuclease IV
MKRVISFALGNIWRWGESKNRADLIQYAKNLGVDGVEITFSSKEELYNFKLSEEDLNWLKSLKYVTIHAPFKLKRKSKDKQEIIKQCDIILKLYQQVNAKDVIIHPLDLPSPEILAKYPFKVSTENLVKKRNVTITKLEKIFQEYPNIGLCLDVAHAYLWSKDETQKLIDAFSERITQFHLSGTYRKKDHQSLRIVTKKFLSSIEPIKKLNVPIVIEEEIFAKDLNYLKEEVEYIKQMFK